jgi:hypothetical protein
MYTVRVITKDETIVSELRTSDKNVANDFVLSEIDRLYYEESDNDVGLFDEDYGYYCMVIRHKKEFEIMVLDGSIQGYKSLYDTKEIVANRLDD